MAVVGERSKLHPGFWRYRRRTQADTAPCSLMNSTINTRLGKREERKLLTGLHTVADLLCATCNTSLGWVYIKAPNGEQQYKEGEWRFLSTARVMRVSSREPERG